jgi:hypothetical protein
VPKNESAGMSDAAVKARTGKTWKQWYALLDKAGANKMEHKNIASHLHERLSVPAWWSQMVTVAYERERGLRQKHQTAEGFRAQRSMTFAAPLSALYAAWEEERARAKWLNEPKMVIRKATKEKSMRITWIDGSTGVEALFYSKGPNKSQLALEHRKLASARDVARMKQYWGGKFTELRKLIED